MESFRNPFNLHFHLASHPSKSTTDPYFERRNGYVISRRQLRHVLAIRAERDENLAVVHARVIRPSRTTYVSASFLKYGLSNK